MRVLVGYLPDGDEPIVDVPLTEIDLAFVQHLFDVPASNPMYDTWRVSTEQLAALTPFLRDPDTTIRYDLDYYLEYFAQHDRLCGRE